LLFGNADSGEQVLKGIRTNSIDFGL
jgi:hypothetical protein